MPAILKEMATGNENKICIVKIKWKNILKFCSIQKRP